MVAATNSDHVLIVDTDADFRALASKLLGRVGFRSEQAEGAEAAFEAVRRKRPLLVVLDVLLPDLSGYGVCRELRDEFGEELPIILVSQERVDPLDRTVGLLIGADDYLVKPLDADEFLARVRRLVTRSRPGSNGRGAVEREFGLTKRELEILHLLAEGRRPSDIASRLVISEKTVASHVQRTLVKLGVHSRAQAVALAYQEGLISGYSESADDVDAHGFLETF